MQGVASVLAAVVLIIIVIFWRKNWPNNPILRALVLIVAIFNAALQPWPRIWSGIIITVYLAIAVFIAVKIYQAIRARVGGGGMSDRTKNIIILILVVLVLWSFLSGVTFSSTGASANQAIGGVWAWILRGAQHLLLPIEEQIAIGILTQDPPLVSVAGSMPIIIQGPRPPNGGQAQQQVQPTPAGPLCVAIVTVERANLRDAPGGNVWRSGIPKDTRLQVFSEKTHTDGVVWYEIWDFNANLRAWISSKVAQKACRP